MPTPSREYSSSMRPPSSAGVHQMCTPHTILARHQGGQQARGNAHGLPAAHAMAAFCESPIMTDADVWPEQDSCGLLTRCSQTVLSITVEHRRQEHETRYYYAA